MNGLSNTQVKILIVDDERSIVNTLRMFLESDNYNVIEAFSGDRAIQKAHSESPDLILLDVMLPDMTGYEVCSRLKKSPSTRSIPIIMLTGLSGISKNDKRLGLELGADDYITKPFDPDELKARIHALLHS